MKKETLRKLKYLAEYFVKDSERGQVGSHSVKAYARSFEALIKELNEQEELKRRILGPLAG